MYFMEDLCSRATLGTIFLVSVLQLLAQLARLGAPRSVVIGIHTGIALLQRLEFAVVAGVQ